jgi:hypothetical protein
MGIKTNTQAIAAGRNSRLSSYSNLEQEQIMKCNQQGIQWRIVYGGQHLWDHLIQG